MVSYQPLELIYCAACTNFSCELSPCEALKAVGVLRKCCRSERLSREGPNLRQVYVGPAQKLDAPTAERLPRPPPSRGGAARGNRRQAETMSALATTPPWMVGQSGVAPDTPGSPRTRCACRRTTRAVHMAVVVRVGAPCKLPQMQAWVRDVPAAAVSVLETCLKRVTLAPCAATSWRRICSRSTSQSDHQHPTTRQSRGPAGPCGTHGLSAGVSPGNHRGGKGVGCRAGPRPRVAALRAPCRASSRWGVQSPPLWRNVAMTCEKMAGVERSCRILRDIVEEFCMS